MACDRWQVVRVPFPFTDRVASKNRPALVLSSAKAFNAPTGHAVLAMITSARHSRWPLDCSIDDLKAAGLPAPSVLRMKLFTLDARLIGAPLGRLADADRKRVATALAQLWDDAGRSSAH